MKEAPINNQYWNLLNHLPKRTVDAIVTDRVLNMDKRSCDNLLKSIMNEKIKEDEKREVQK